LIWYPYLDIQRKDEDLFGDYLMLSLRGYMHSAFNERHFFLLNEENLLAKAGGVLLQFDSSENGRQLKT
jgi:hypothetical protein